MQATGTAATDKTTIKNYATIRYTDANAVTAAYLTALDSLVMTNLTFVQSILAMEFNYTAAYFALTQLQDKLQYNPNRIVLPGWDDQNIVKIGGTVASTGLDVISPLHTAVMNAAEETTEVTEVVTESSEDEHDHDHSEEEEDTTEGTTAE
jgi:hypothetical protein